MKEIQLTIKALSPLAIGMRKPGGSVSEAQDYIPGSVIRGAIAAQILQYPGVDQAQPGGDFQRLFLDDGAAIFSNAYPTIKNRQGDIVPVRLLPATAVSSKSNPGFHTSNSDNHGVFDTLIDRFCAEGHHHLYDPNCPQDGGRVEPYGGFYTVATGDDGKTIYSSQKVETRLLTRVGINRRRATAQENILYSIEVISETRKKGEQDTRFSGTVRLADETLASVLTDFINAQSQSLRLGGSASRGLGKVEIAAQLQDCTVEVEHRIEQFNQQLHKRWHAWDIFGKLQNSPLENRHFFSLDLQSDAILTDQWRRTMVISPEMLCQETGVTDPDLELHASYSSYDYHSGWNAAWGLMKDVELVTKRGSVYLFSTPQIDQWLPALESLEQRGVGDRTCEGFGQIRVCDEFHTIFREEAV
jgi:CRISPR-associated protein Csx10